VNASAGEKAAMTDVLGGAAAKKNPGPARFRSVALLPLAA
jgi:hypothetical protein